MFALKCEHVRFVQDVIVWPKWPQTETAQTKTAQTKSDRSKSRVPAALSTPQVCLQ